MSRLKVLLACLLLLLPHANAAQESPALPVGYAQVAQGDNWTLYLKEANLGLILQHNGTGKLMYSTVENPQDYKDNDLWKGFYQSGIVLEYIEGTINKYPWANLVTTDHTKTFTYHPDGFDCEVAYTALGISYRVEVRLKDDELRVYIPQSGIREENPQFTVGSFYVYPFMGYTTMGQSGGYLFIPDGQGALIELKDNEGRFSSPYKSTVYGNNIGLTELAQGALMNNFSTNNPAERALMPVFGVRHEDTQLGFVSIIESGDTSATIQATMNGVGNMGFDWVSAMYTYRVVYPQSTGPGSGTLNMRTPRAKRFDIAQRFHFLQGEDATYAGMASSYRDYLRQSGVFDRADADAPFGIQVDFLGAERENGLVGTRGVTMTTAAQAGEMLERLAGLGVRDSISVFKGWEALGFSGARPTTAYEPAGFLGGRQGFASLYQKAANLDWHMMVEADVATLNPATAGTLVYEAMKKVDSNTFNRNLYGQVYASQQLLNPDKSLELARKLAPELAEAGVPGVSLTGLTQQLFDYSFRKTYFDSADCADTYTAAALAFADKLPTVLQNANAYLWGKADALTNMPIAGSDYVYTSREVPFLAIALSGGMPVYAEYANFQANARQFFLRLAEQGVRPAFLITQEDPIRLQDTNANHVYSSRFELYEQLMADWYEELSGLHERLRGAAITSHEAIGDLRVVGWSNGDMVLVNMAGRDLVYKGMLVPALDWKVVTQDELH